MQIVWGTEDNSVWIPGKGNCERSDIDIAVSGVASHEILDLQENLEEIPTLYTIDLVDLDTCQNQLLLEDIKQYGREIYKKI